MVDRRTVSREELEQMLEELRREIRDPADGLHGPSSFVWTVDREAVLFLGGGRAALLQLAHPFVAHAVDQHSQTRTDPLGRFQRTFENVFAMVFGDFDSAVRSSLRVHKVHTRIHGVLDEDVGIFPKGHSYRANDEASLMWVHATLVDSAIQMFELIVRPLTADEKDTYYAETKRFARLFGISDRVLPPDWISFRHYWKAMLESGEIAVGRPAKEIARFLFTPRRPSYAGFVRWVEILTAGLLPEAVREGFGMEWGLGRRAIFRSSVAALRATHPLLPKTLRHQPAYVAAKRRRAGLEPTATSQWVEQVTQGLLNQAPLHALVRPRTFARR
ncbi:MAG: DUF2236 domain-containing protein [Deltaproteobacteria bacterium]|nr:DUF2236 domain-containing protein [Deltaproteobacteria bacterium]